MHLASLPFTSSTRHRLSSPSATVPDLTLGSCVHMWRRHGRISVNSSQQQRKTMHISLAGNRFDTKTEQTFRPSERMRCNHYGRVHMSFLVCFRLFLPSSIHSFLYFCVRQTACKPVFYSFQNATLTNAVHGSSRLGFTEMYAHKFSE